MSVIDEIKQKVDIVEVVGQYVELKKSGRTFRAACPFHSEKKPSFFVYPEQQTWHCFGACNTGGDVFSFIMKKEGLDFGDAIRLLAEKTGVVLPSRANFEAEDRARDKILQLNQTAAQYFHNLLLNSQTAENPRQYLNRRGLNDKSISDFQLGYSLPNWESLKLYFLEKGFEENQLFEAGLIIKSPETGKSHDRFRNHLMFPITDERGRVTGFGARVLDPASEGPKYINSPQTLVFDKSGSLFGINLARSGIREKNLAVMVEGYMDVIIAHQFGFNNVIAPMGVAITEKQINQIKKLTRNIALALDPDAAGEEAAMRCISYENSLDAEVKVITLPVGRDPDEVILNDAAQWQSLVGKAKPVIEYAINVIAAKFDLKTTQGKTEIVRKLLPILAGVKNIARQDSYLTRLSELTGITRRNLEAALIQSKPEKKLKMTGEDALKRAARSIGSRPVEEFLLALLLQNPDLQVDTGELLADYFENSENRAIFNKWQEFHNSAVIHQSLDATIQEHFDSLLKKHIPPDSLQEKYNQVLLRLREDYVRNIVRRKSEAFELEDARGAVSDIQDKGIDDIIKLKEIFYLKVDKSKEGKNEKR
jgi:DNA primase